MGDEKTAWSVAVIEDEDFYRDLLVRQLERHGWTVTGTAATGEEADELLARWKEDASSLPDCVILDLILPGAADQFDEVVGIEILGALRKQWPKLPVLVLTKLGDKATRDKCDNAGATGYVVKGELRTFQIAELLDKLIAGER